VTMDRCLGEIVPPPPEDTESPPALGPTVKSTRASARRSLTGAINSPLQLRARAQRLYPEVTSFPLVNGYQLPDSPAEAIGAIGPLTMPLFPSFTTTRDIPMTNPFDIAAHVSTISNPNAGDPVPTPTPARGTTIEHRPATGAGAIFDPNNDSLVVHGNAGSESLHARSHDFTGQIDLQQQGQQLAKAVTDAEQRLAAASSYPDKVQAAAQLDRARDRVIFGMNHLANIAKSRADK
jgi:hypothetical protein